ncbi:MAG: hypothetical protein ACNA7Y_06070, partial [Gammaproteobacteria bacterium]
KAMLDKPEKIAWISQNNVSRDHSKIPAALLNTAFALPLSTRTTVTLPSGDVAIVSVTKIIPGSTHTTPIERKAIQDQLIRAYGESDYRVYTQELMDNAKIDRSR